MKLITRDTDYAIRALCFMAEHRKKRVSVAELVKRLKIPRPFLRKILQILNKKRLLKSYRGQDGGFALALPPNKIFLDKLIEIFQGKFKFNNCILRKNICPEMKTCPLRKKIESIERDLTAELKSISIALLLENKQKHRVNKIMK
jgi:Rrf2 family protein